MVKQSFLWATYVALTLGLGLDDGSATEAPSADVAEWMDAAIAGKQPPAPEGGDALERDEVQAQTTLLWNAYKDAASRAGWDKELGVIGTFEQKKARVEKWDIEQAAKE